MNRPSSIPLWLILSLLIVSPLACTTGREAGPGGMDGPAWAQDAVFYQIFPERFRNGDPGNDPVRSSLDYLQYVPESWAVSRWTKDWYAQDDWEREKSDNVYSAMFDRRFGGDLQGVMDKLDYLEALGITAIWFNPVFSARSLHKYDGSSFHHIDPHFGPDPEGDLALVREETDDPSTWSWTAADRLFLNLVSEAHDRGIRIVLDGVFNHTGRGFFAFEDLKEHQAASPYRDWYNVSSFDDPSTPESEFAYAGWWGYEALPEFADNADSSDLHPEVKAYIMASTARWMDPDDNGDPSDGIDGWRLDVAQEVPDGFWNQWNAHVRALNPEAYTVAEIWEPAAEYISRTGFSGAMNYHAFAMPVKGFLVDGTGTAEEFSTVLDERRNGWAPGSPENQLNLVDSHDTPRLASMIVNRDMPYRGGGNDFDYDSGVKGPKDDANYNVGPPGVTDTAILRLVALFQMTYVGIPIVYYGTESGMWGADDPDDRKPMLWDDLTYDDQAVGPFGLLPEVHPVAFRDDIFRFYQEVIALRKGHHGLSTGTVSFETDAEHEHLIIMHRESEFGHYVVLINRGAEDVQTTWNPPVGASLLLHTNGAPVELSTGLRMPGLSGAVYHLQ